jgi:hypothetical protein
MAIGWYLWFELDHAPDARAAARAGMIMASVVQGARLVPGGVQSRVSHRVGQEDLEAAARNRRLKIEDTDTNDGDDDGA